MKGKIILCCIFLVLFQLVFSQSVDLTLGKPLESEVLNGGYAFFKVNEIPDPLPNGKSVIFTVTPYTGDSGLYISHTTQTPKEGDSTWKDVTVGHSLIQINNTDPNFKPKGPYFIGVRAFTNSSFTILAHITDDIVTLTDGQPQLNDVPAYGYQYYFVDHTTTGRLLISLTAIQGDPDVFVSMINERPGWNNHTWAHYDVGTDILIIPNAVAGRYYISVTSFEYTRYNLLVSGYDTISRIAEFVPIVEEAEARTSKYFKFKLLDQRSLEFTVNKVRNDGDPDIYISTVHERPNSTHHEWKGINFGDDTVSIPTTDPKFKSPSWYYVAVYGFLSVTFKLSVKHEDGHIALSVGQSATGKIAVAGRYNYFLYRAAQGAEDEELQFTAYARTGSIQIYASKIEKYPSIESNEKVGTHFGASTKIVYVNPTPNIYYYVSVRAESPAEYSIVATQDHAYTILKEGESHLYLINANKTKYFLYKVNAPNQDIAISVNSYTGRAETYVGYNFPPSRENFTWSGTASNYKGIEIVATTDDPNRNPSREENFYVTVYAAPHIMTYCSLTAYHSNTTVILRDGQIQVGSVPLYEYKYYKYISDRAGILNIDLKSLYRNGSRLADSDLYVSKIFEKPSSTQYEWFSNRYGDDHLTIDATPGTYYIAVYGARFYGSDERFLPFQISAAIDYESLNTYGISTFGFVRKGEMRYYTANIQPRGEQGDSNIGVTLISGATELYVYDNDTKPTNRSYKYRDRGWPGNTLKLNSSLPSFKYGTYRYGVYGLMDSEFFMHATIGNYEAALTINQPKLIELKTGDNYVRIFGVDETITKRNYYFNINFNNVNWFTPTVTVYASQDEAFPSEASFKWKLLVQNKNAHMLLDEEKIVAGKNIYINVVYAGRFRTRMRVNFVVPGEPMFVTQDQPQVRDLMSNEIGYYLAFRPPPSKMLKVVLESCNAVDAPTMYVSTTRRRPNAGNAEMTSTAESRYIQVITNNTIPDVVKNFYLATDQKPEARSVSLYVTTLQDIRPQPRTRDLMSLGVSEKDTVKISVPSIINDVDQYPILYTAFYKKVTSFDDKVNMDTACSMWDNGNADFADFSFQTTYSPNIYMGIPVESHSKYIVNVVASDRYSVRSSYKPLNVIVAGTNSLLPGKAIQTTVNVTEYDQFVIDSIDFKDDNAAIIVVTPYSGEPELYISLQSPATRENAIYVANYTGPKIITIDKNNQRGNGPYYVGIRGYTDCAFSIMMYYKNGEPHVQLLDGIPQLATTEARAWSYFSFYLDDNSSLSVSVSPTVGDPDLFISHLTQWPSWRERQWRSENPGADVIHISNSSSNYAPNKMYYVGVFGFVKSTYSIVFTKTLSSELLTENLPHTQIVFGANYAFFKFRLMYRHDLIVSVKPADPFSKGDPDLCISRRNPQPTPRGFGGCMWSSARSGADTIEIPTTDPNYRLGWYYVSVRGYNLKETESLLFNILATTSYHNETLLIDGVGVSVVEQTVGESYNFFKFYYGFELDDNHLTFTASEYSGNVQLFVSDMTNSEPRREKHAYAGVRRGSIVQVELPNTIKEGWYYCGVLTTQPANYTITASTNQVPIVLPYGQAYFAVVPSKYFRFFTYRIQPEDLEEDIIIATRSYNGDPDIYVSSGYRPRLNRYDWRSYRASRSDWVRITSKDLKERKVIVLQIGVYTYSDEESAFSIIVYRSQSNLRLVNGHPIPGVVKLEEYQYYNYELAEKGRVKFSMQITSPTPNNAMLCVSTTTEEPNIYDCEYLATNEGLHKYSVTIDDAEAGSYYLGVYGSVGSNVSYVLTASTLYEYVDDGFDTYEQVDKDSAMNFKTFIRKGADHVMSSVTLVKGKTILYANSNSTLPTPTNYMWKAESWPGNSIYVDSNDTNFKTNTEWSFAVYGVADVSNFLFSTQTAFGRLRSGIPRTGIISKVKPAFFYMSLPFYDKEDIYIQAKAFDGSCISLYSSLNDVYPNKTQFDHHATSTNRFNTAVIKYKKEEIENAYLINFGVYGCDNLNHRFEISVASASEPFFLPFDRPYVLSSDKNRPNNWFEVLTNPKAESLNVYLDICDDVPVDVKTLFIGNSTKEFPITEANADFQGTKTGLYSSTISTKNIKAEEQYKITVAFPGDRLFSLYATTDPVDLRPNCSKLSYIEVANPENKPGQRSISVTMFPVTSTSYPVTVKIYAAETSQSLTNMETVCAVQRHGSLLETFTLNRDQSHQTNVKLDIASPYRLNAIMMDKEGRIASCRQVSVPKGSFIRPTVFYMSVGSVLILVAIFSIVIYLIVGIIYKKIRFGSKGLDMIPNIEFWKDVPFLIGDGIMFMFTCGKKPKVMYEEMEENPFGASEDTYHEI